MVKSWRLKKGHVLVQQSVAQVKGEILGVLDSVNDAAKQVCNQYGSIQFPLQNSDIDGESAGDFGQYLHTELQSLCIRHANLSLRFSLSDGIVYRTSVQRKGNPSASRYVPLGFVFFLPYVSNGMGLRAYNLNGLSERQVRPLGIGIWVEMQAETCGKKCININLDTTYWYS
jgi:hypothetical protein